MVSGQISEKVAFMVKKQQTLNVLAYNPFAIASIITACD